VKQAVFHFEDALNVFLPRNHRGQLIICPFNGDQSVKHLIESMGVPHVEVKQILINGQPTDFTYLVQDGDRVDVYPYTPEDFIDAPQEENRFILDSHLGRLAGYLRMLGIDTLYRNDYHDDELANISRQENRILLTRDRRLLMRNLVSRGYWLRSKIPHQQLVEVLDRYNLSSQTTPFRRCIRCNHLVKPISKAAVLPRLEPLTRRYFNEFSICLNCDQVYWQGSHYERMQRFIDQVLVGPIQGGKQ
jgi:uncharacterized protein with PIN domain